jgi:hypothetical protein
MDFKDSVLQLAERIKTQKDVVQTEEATKNAFVLPLISALGYDVFNPFEVVPELDCDLIKKKGEKIDYAIKHNDETILLIECKHCSSNLDLHNSQLQKYFVASNARFGALTNGVEYRFYTDLEKQNIMDSKPFLVVNLLDLSDADIEQLKKFHKSYYNVDAILSTAQELKYTTQLKSVLLGEIFNPADEFVRFIAKKVYSGVINQKVLDQFRPLVSAAIETIINDRISDRLGIAMKTTTEIPQPQTAHEESPSGEPNPEKMPALPFGVVAVDEEKGIVTTQEEIEGYLIVKAILRPVVDVSRVVYRDAQTYFSILLDDNNRRPICRLRFNAKSVKYIGLFDAERNEEKVEIQSLDDIYNYADQLRATVLIYNK